MMKDYYTVKQVVDKSNTYRLKIIRLIGKGVLDGEKIGRDWFVKKDSANSWLKKFKDR